MGLGDSSPPDTSLRANMVVVHLGRRECYDINIHSNKIGLQILKSVKEWIVRTIQQAKSILIFVKQSSIPFGNEFL
ncbi:hypothetical protein CEXT_661061 [Caerostris extrusa]|uniref:Uncharacterized protein n=1 Tax=Caerostris extrusa TaxID=172846 RepID=A0AAV4NHW8_CAEEX|nr:hypothetical protein CEXT_661061 [Caerostris extrusa]